MSGKDMSKYINWAKEQDCSKLFYTRDVMIEGLYKGDKEICQYVKAMHAGIDMFDTLLRKVQLLSFKVHECREIAAKSQWIPVSERLPETSGTYQVTCSEGKILHSTYAKFQCKLKRWDLTGARSYWKVTAWMPLPEPYKEE